MCLWYFAMEADNGTSTAGRWELCERAAVSVSDNSTAAAAAADCSAAAVEQTTPSTHPALYFFIIARLMNGIGNSGTTVLSVAYIDENTSKTKSPLYIGISCFRQFPFSSAFRLVVQVLPVVARSTCLPDCHAHTLGLSLYHCCGCKW